MVIHEGSAQNAPETRCFGMQDGDGTVHKMIQKGEHQ